MEEDVPYPRFASRGRTYVYVLPCRDEDLLKVGFSRDPMARLRSLHPRFFTFFDLDRGLLLETDRLRDARRVERRLIERFAVQRAPAPLAVRDAAAGYTEWFRGVAADAEALVRRIGDEEALPLHAPLRPWLRARLAESHDWLYAASATLLEAIEYERFNPPSAGPLGRAERTLGQVLDTYVAIGLDVAALVPPTVWRWYGAREGVHFDERGHDD